MSPGKPGKSWNSILAFSRLESARKRLLVLESSGNLFNSNAQNKLSNLFTVASVGKPNYLAKNMKCMEG